ncbi:MAG: SAM-dependent methyltransferase [Proteobacteria bacterium]|nr:SAM-dependent methyltransferase [Pseudomonadota bacterium]
MTENPRLIEEPVRQSLSKLWQIQRNYFASMGIRAWKEEVPFYISSNAFTGHQYALLAVQFIRDWLRKHPNNQPYCHILEVGSGPGKFSFYFLKSFKTLLSNFDLNLKFTYIMSDLIEENLKFCQENLSFKSYIDAHELDFACFNLEKDADFNLMLKQVKFSSVKANIPLIVIANYTLDCIAQDEFEYKNGHLYEVRLGLKSRYKNFDIQKSMYLNDLRLTFEKVELQNAQSENYYEQPYLNEILTNYPSYFSNKTTRFSMPVGAVRFLDNLNAMTDQSYFMIVGDKGLTIPERFSLYDDKFRVSYDGCYSFSVNFHALGECLKKMGGDCLLTHNSNEFKVNLYCMGATFADLDETKNYFKNTVSVTGPEEYCYIFDEFSTSGYRFSLKSLFAFLRFSQWDPNAYAVVHDQIIELLPSATAQFTEDMIDDLNKVADNLYRINIGDDVFNLTGMFFQIQEENEKALALYHKSLEVFGERAPAHNNMAMIYEDQKNIPKAIYHFQKTLSLDSKNRLAKKRLYNLTGRPYLALIAPIIKGALIFALLIGAIYLITKR